MKKFYFLCLIAIFAVTTKANAALTVDDLVGTYCERISGSDWWNYESWLDFEYSDVVTISKVDDTTISITNIYDWGTTLTGKVNLRTRTITLEPQNLNTWYVFSGYPWDEGGTFVNTNPVIATISEDGKTIEIEDWALSYTEFSTVYVLAYSKLTKEDEPLWSVTGTYDAGELGTGEATVEAYDDYYLINGFLPNQNMRLTVSENSELVVFGGSGYPNNYYGEDTYVWYYDLYNIEDYVNEVPGDDMWICYGEGTYAYVSQEGGVITFPYGYYTSTENEVEDILDTYTLVWGTGVGINSTKAVSTDEAPVYNLSGMRMANRANLQKGVYISNGKKFVVK